MSAAAVHPFGVASPFLASLPLAEHGLRWRWPEIDLAHPLDDGSAGVLVRGRWPRRSRGWAATATHGGAAFGPLVAGFDALAAEVLGPIVRIPSHPLRMARFGLARRAPATVLRRAGSRTEQAPEHCSPACAAHIFQPLNRPVTASVGR